MNSVYERLRTLLEDLGFSFDEGSITRAEIMAYSNGIQLVREGLESSLGVIRLGFDDENALSHYCKQLSINPRGYSPQQLKEYICERMSERKSLFTDEQINTAFSRLRSGEYEIGNGVLTISDVAMNDFDRLGEFIKSYVPFCCEVIYDGSGMCFDEWDAIGKCWNEYDRMKLPFDVIDKLGGNGNE